MNPDGTYRTDGFGHKLYGRDHFRHGRGGADPDRRPDQGQVFPRYGSDTIEKTFAAIDQAQKIEFQAKSYLLTTELFAWFAVPGAALLFLGALFALPPEWPRGRARIPLRAGPAAAKGLAALPPKNA
jgi:hypothetical protein